MGTLIVVSGALKFSIPAMAYENEVRVYPDRPITLVVGFPPGGMVDILGRHVAQAMTDELGQRVIVENRPGATGSVGALSVARAAPDGYTVYLSSSAVMIYLAAQMEPALDLSEALAPVGKVAIAPSVIVIGNHVKANTLQELIQLAKTNPGRLNMVSPGVNSLGHIFGEAFQEAAGVKFHHIPHLGAAPAFADILGERADLMITSVPSAWAFINSNRVRVIAVLSHNRLSQLPDTPTMKELGYPALQNSDWSAVFTPAGTPSHVISRLNRSINKILADAKVRKQLTGLGYMVKLPNNTPENLEDLVAQESRQWKQTLH
ncbi:tripartite tricarboxylate transporter substrate binding protein [Bordetella sp. LUAb4]|uniref:Bug family tripartite tricarboxylate transporter substrate binding protein n=1 Tax=Bordetella sp. LUAb4 TaxID=2843195 RepID=UPI001E4169DC|nr:tripartite tricarboxylate transporter substrate binding protein [Bordetella sp. LUAb4]